MQELKNFYRKTVLKIFKNRLGIFMNLKFILFWFLIRTYRFFNPLKLDETSVKCVTELNNNGVLVIDSAKKNQLMTNISFKANELLNNDEYIDNELKNNGLIRLKDSSLKIDNLTEIFNLPEVHNLIKSYFKSNFYIYSSDVYRTIPIDETSKPFDSTDWHFDNASFDMLKVFVYLTDVTEETGALKLTGRNISDNIKNKGIFLREDIDKYTNEIEKEEIIVEGEAGTIIFFTPHSNMHKATLPSLSFRNAAVFLVYPSFSYKSSESEKRKLEISRNYGYMTNPFTKKPLRIGNS